jgi:hypothetical protein
VVRRGVGRACVRAQTVRPGQCEQRQPDNWIWRARCARMAAALQSTPLSASQVRCCQSMRPVCDGRAAGDGGSPVVALGGRRDLQFSVAALTVAGKFSLPAHAADQSGSLAELQELGIAVKPEWAATVRGSVWEAWLHTDVSETSTGYASWNDDKLAESRFVQVRVCDLSV